METINLIKTPTIKEQRELAIITARLAKLDMERAELLKQIRNNTAFAIQHIKDKISRNIGKYYKAYKGDAVYVINSAHVVLSKRGSEGKMYVVTLWVTKFDTSGQSHDSKYDLSSPELPKDVDMWLTMGNTEMPLSEAKSYVTAALLAEKKALQSKIDVINKKLK